MDTGFKLYIYHKVKILYIHGGSKKCMSLNSTLRKTNKNNENDQSLLFKYIHICIMYMMAKNYHKTINKKVRILKT